MKVWQAIITFDDYEPTVLMAETREAVEQKLYEWVKAAWAEELEGVDMPDDPYNTISACFEFMGGEELVDIVEVEVPFPVVLVVHDRKIFKELTDVLGIEPFSYYNGDGWNPHQAVYNEVAYRLSSLYGAEVPNLRKLLMDLYKADVHGVIVVDKE